MNLPPAEEAKLNAAGDKLAEMLHMKRDNDASPDSQGRIRWKTTYGNKTGIGVIRSIESFVADELRSIERTEFLNKA